MSVSEEIINLSESDDLQCAIDEWACFEYSVTNNEERGECFCGRKIKHMYCFCNIHNDNLLILGSGCQEHFKPQIKEYKKLVKSNKKYKLELPDCSGLTYEESLELLKSYLDKHQACVGCKCWIPKNKYRPMCLDCYKENNKQKCEECEIEIPFSKTRKLCKCCWFEKNMINF